MVRHRVGTLVFALAALAALAFAAQVGCSKQSDSESSPKSAAESESQAQAGNETGDTDRTGGESAPRLLALKFHHDS